MDPYSPVQQPSDSIYRAARWVRDFPIDHPILAGLGALLLPYSPILSAPAWTAAAVYSTGREISAALPTAVKTLMRIGRGQHEFHAPMIDTSAARSMRQASLRAIHDSGYMTRAVIGNEARILHS